LFSADLLTASAEREQALAADVARIVAAVHGSMRVRSAEVEVPLAAGDFCLVPASVSASAQVAAGSECLVVEAGS
jgi:hypothetical protein